MSQRDRLDFHICGIDVVEPDFVDHATMARRAHLRCHLEILLGFADDDASLSISVQGVYRHTQQPF